MKWIISALVALALMGATTLYYRQATSLFAKYSSIKEGMMVGEVEKILGLGEELQHDMVPRSPKGPFVEGDYLLKWINEDDSIRIYVGFREGKVVTKRYFEIDL